MSTSVLSYNVNGIRAAARKGLFEYFEKENPDIICLQEIKARPEDLDQSILEFKNYHAFWYPAEKKGYSGVAIYAKEAPKHVEYGMGMEKYDKEGRVLRIDYSDYSVMSVYVPSGSSGEHRQEIKDEFMADFYVYIQELIKDFPKLIISGDFNICHKEIDIHNPVSNKKSSGFLPHERKWLTEFLELGLIDSFRHFNPDPHHYTWWSYRANARANNKGWRIDYHMVTEKMLDQCQEHVIHTEAKHSDHCPIELKIK